MKISVTLTFAGARTSVAFKPLDDDRLLALTIRALTAFRLSCELDSVTPVQHKETLMMIERDLSERSTQQWGSSIRPPV